MMQQRTSILYKVSLSIKNKEEKKDKNK